MLTRTNRKQLQDKQFIMEKLLDGNRPNHSSIQARNSLWNRRQNITVQYIQWRPFSQTICNFNEKKTAKAASQTEQPSKLNQEEGPAKSTRKSNEVHSRQLDQNEAIWSKQDIMKKRKRITIFGDSMLNGFLDDKLQKDHNVQVKRHPGATTRYIVDYVRPVIKKNLTVL